ncbi:MAG: hypothetical protein QGH40_02665, partial [bacterium]|nr:hypothetical protein [bacterium]
RFLRIHNILLLLLRIMVLILLALLFATPFMNARWLPFATGIPPVSRLILIDDSASLAVSTSGAPVWKQAQDAALKQLQAMRSQDEVLVLLGSKATRGQSGKLHPPHGGDSRLIEESVPFRGTVNMTRALETAFSLMEEARHPEREILLISDFWSSSFPDVNSLRLNPKIKLKPISIKSPPPDNMAIEEVSFSPAIIALGQPVTFRVRVTNTGVVPRPDYPIAFFVNQEKVQEQRCSIQPGRSFELTYQYRMKTGGVNEITFSGGSDDYAPDNDYHCSVAVSDVFYVLSVSGIETPVRSEDEVFYLNTSLNPLDVPDLERGFIIQPVRVSSHELETMDLNRFDVVCLANLSSLSTETTERLVQYVESGGGLAIFPGDEVKPELFNASMGDLLPAPLVETVGKLNDENSVFHLSDLDTSHPVLSAFPGNLSQSLTIPSFHRFFRIVTETFSPETAVLAKLDRESPALIERQLGKGRIILAAFPIDADWSDLPHHPVFPPLVHQIFHYLNRRKQAQVKPVPAGEPYHRVIPDATPEMVIILHRPDESTEQIPLKATSRLFFVDIPNTVPPGHYRVELVYPETNRQEYIRFASNIPSQESEFTPLPDTALSRLSNRKHGEMKKRGQTSWPLATPLALLLLGCLCCESILCAMYTRRWET